MSRQGLWLVVFLLLGASSASAQPQWLFPLNWGEPGLEHGNGNKIVVGRFNTLHAVYMHNSYVIYRTSADGQAWTPPAYLNAPPTYPNALPSSQPAIAVDGAGSLGVVWVGNPNVNGLGPLYYAYKTAASTTWTKVPLGVTGTEPAIIGSGPHMYLTWTEINKVRFAKLTTLSPPAGLAAETIEQTSCTGTGFRKPAITLIQDPCRPPIVRVGYLYYRDEQSVSPSDPCFEAAAKVGPRVCERSSTTSTWSLVYQDVVGSVTPSSVEPLSLSIASDFPSGRTFLAWSDSTNGSARTKLANRQPGGWYVTPLANERRHVHVRAGGSVTVPSTEFRLAWTKSMPGIDEFFNLESTRAVGSWTGAAPVFTETVDLSPDFAVGRPQAVRWRRCAAGNYASVNAYFEAEAPCAEAFVATDYAVTAPCPTAGLVVGVASPCHKFEALAATLGTGVDGPKTVMDVGDIGAIVEVGATYARVRTPDQRTAWITWSSGRVLATSDTTMTISAPRSAVAVRGEGFSVTTIESGHLAAYDGALAPPPAQCLR